MSSRAIRALRGQKSGAAAIIPESVSEVDVDDDDDDYNKTASAFAMMMMPDENESSSSSEEDEEDTTNTFNKTATNTDEKEESWRLSVVAAAKKQEQAEEDDDDEDLDALISEFHEKDTNEATAAKENALSATPLQTSSSSPLLDKIMDGFDARDLDYEYSMRTSLLQASAGEATAANTSNARRRAPLLFGPARDGWVRPPRLVGGGMGMTTYYYCDDKNVEDEEHRSVPWPYNASTLPEEALQQHQWCTFVHSDSYQRDVNDYYSVIQQSGDLNALCMFVMHHPFVTPALLQLTTVLYQTNHSQQGFELLRRILWIYETSALLTFNNSIVQQDGNNNNNVRFLMDKEQPENTTFFQALFRLIQISNIAGLSRTAFAVTRLLFSFDPLRDPTNVLLVMDKYALEVALSSNEIEQKTIFRWLIDLVESDLIRLWYRETSGGTEETFQCDLVNNLPNWSYSYAFALFQTYRIMASYEHDDDTDCAALKEKANKALRAAIGRFPSVVGLLLQHLEVDTSGRSFQRDWVTVLDFATDRARQLARQWHRKSDVDNVTLSATMQTCDKIIRIFVQTSSKLWGDDDVLQWVFDNLKEMHSLGQQKQEQPGIKLPEAPSPAIMRYSGADPADFEDKIQQLPQEANIIDPGLLAHAMVVNPNRGRFLRNMQHQREDPNGFMVDENGNRVPAHQQRRALFGPPTEVVDPDWPMLEVFWRSMLPWNHVEGMQPPPR